MTGTTNISGIVALIAGAVLFVTGFCFVRRSLYRFFLGQHQSLHLERVITDKTESSVARRRMDGVYCRARVARSEDRLALARRFGSSLRGRPCSQNRQDVLDDGVGRAARRRNGAHQSRRDQDRMARRTARLAAYSLAGTLAVDRVASFLDLQLGQERIGPAAAHQIDGRLDLLAPVDWTDSRQQKGQQDRSCPHPRSATGSRRVWVRKRLTEKQRAVRRHRPTRCVRDDRARRRRIWDLVLHVGSRRRRVARCRRRWRLSAAGRARLVDQGLDARAMGRQATCIRPLRPCCLTTLMIRTVFALSSSATQVSLLVSINVHSAFSSVSTTGDKG